MIERLESIASIAPLLAAMVVHIALTAAFIVA